MNIQFTVNINKEVFELSKIICKKVHYEWYAFALGNVSKHENIITFYVEDLLIPQQEVSPTDAIVLPKDSLKAIKEMDLFREHKKHLYIIGMWHSHGDMPVFNSAVDQENIKTIYRTLNAYIKEIDFKRLIIGVSKDIPRFNVRFSEDGVTSISISGATIQLSFKLAKPLSDPKAFAKIYAELYSAFKLLKHYCGLKIMTERVIEKIKPLISIVVNNRGEVIADVFILDEVEIDERIKRARVNIVEMPRKPIFLIKENLKSILERIIH